MIGIISASEDDAVPPTPKRSKPEPPPKSNKPKPKPTSKASSSKPTPPQPEAPPTAGPSNAKPRPKPRPAGRGTPGYIPGFNFWGSFASAAAPAPAINPHPVGVDHDLWDAEAMSDLSWVNLIKRILARFPHPVEAKRTTYGILAPLSARHQYMRMTLVSAVVLNCFSSR